MPISSAQKRAPNVIPNHPHPFMSWYMSRSPPRSAYADRVDNISEAAPTVACDRFQHVRMVLLFAVGGEVETFGSRAARRPYRLASNARLLSFCSATARIS